MKTSETSETSKTSKTSETSKTDTVVNPEKADTEEKTNHYNLFGQPSFDDPGTPKGKRRPPGKKYPLDDLTDFAVARKPLICVVFSDFVGEENQFSEVEKIQLRYAVSFTSVITRQVLHVIKPGPSQFDYVDPPPQFKNHLSKIHPRPNHFEEQLMFWFGSTSPEVTRSVREGMLKMHTLLTNPLEIIRFVKDCAIKKWSGDGFQLYPGAPSADKEDFAIPEANRRVPPGNVIAINELKNYDKLGVSEMVRYIFHELTFDVLKLPKFFPKDHKDYSLSFRTDNRFTDEARCCPLRVAALWTQFAWKIFELSRDLPEVEMWTVNGNLQASYFQEEGLQENSLLEERLQEEGLQENILPKTFAEFNLENFQCLVDDDDLSL